MKRCPSIRLALCGALLLLSGCLFVQHSTRVVRENERQRQVRFESEQARNLFLAGVTEMQNHKQTSNVKVSAMPFLWWYSRGDVPSDNAIYNDQLRACDTSGDDLITVQEARGYRMMVAEKVKANETRLAEAKSNANDAKTLAAPSVAQRPQEAPQR